MNTKVMVRILFAALFILTCFAGTGTVRAEKTTQFVVEGENLVVRETEVVKVKQFLMPPNVDIPEKDLPKIYEILEQGKGDYVLSTAEVKAWKWGVPMKMTTQTVNNVISLSNGTWLWHRVVSGAPKIETNWSLTLDMAIVIVLMLAISLMHQKSGDSEWWLLAFYGAQIAATGFVLISDDVDVTTNPKAVFAVFVACVIVASYAIAKLAKRLGWIKVVGKPVKMRRCMGPSL